MRVYMRLTVLISLAYKYLVFTNKDNNPRTDESALENVQIKKNYNN